MNEGKSQYIGIILISILVYILMVRSCQPEEVVENTETVTTEQTDTVVTEVVNDTTTLVKETVIIVQNGDSIEMDAAEYAAQNSFGAFYSYASGTEQDIVLENNLVKLTLSSKGAQVKRVELKEFKNFEREPLILIDETHLVNYTLHLKNSGSNVETKDLYFESKEENGKVIFYANAGSGSLSFEFALTEDSYLVDYNVKMDGLDNILDLSNKSLELDWNYQSSLQEQDFSSEKTKSTAYWKVFEDDVEHLGIGKSKEEDIEPNIQWMSYKQRFFNVTLLNEETFKNVSIATDIESKDSSKVAGYIGSLDLAYDGNGDQGFDMQFYFGPNNYKLLKGFKNDMHQVVELSADFFLFRWVKWINAWLIIPLFNFIEKFIPNYGIIILIMTLVIKMLLMPLTFKSYVSTAKTKVLKPELEALKEKFGDDSAGYSKAQMELYSKTGVSMFGGCLPMLLQMPFLLAMFYFFPSSIELRQEAFLWAQDLSTFDTVPFLTWSYNLPVIGTHLSVFTILMTVSSILMAKFNPQMQSQPSQPGMEMMKYMPYIFPFFLLFLFNNFPAALTYYYFLSNMITFGQQIVINKFFIDEEKLKAQIEENKKKPVKKSKWAAKMEDIYKQQQQMQEQQKKK